METLRLARHAPSASCSWPPANGVGLGRHRQQRLPEGLDVEHQTRALRAEAGRAVRRSPSLLGDRAPHRRRRPQAEGMTLAASRCRRPASRSAGASRSTARYRTPAYQKAAAAFLEALALFPGDVRAQGGCARAQADRRRARELRSAQARALQGGRADPHKPKTGGSSSSGASSKRVSAPKARSHARSGHARRARRRRRDRRRIVRRGPRAGVVPDDRRRAGRVRVLRQWRRLRA